MQCTVVIVMTTSTQLLRKGIDKLNTERADLDRFDAYFRNGNFDALHVPAKVRADLFQLVKQGVTPWLRLVVETTAERAIVDGFRLVNSDTVESELWSWWQANRLDGRQMAQNVETIKSGYSYVSVWPGTGENEAIPVISPEPPFNVHVEYEGDDPFTATSAIKVRGQRAWLYPDDEHVVAFRTNPQDPSGWEKIGELENSLGKIPFVKFRANPTIDGGHVSDLEVAIPIQDRINRTTVDRLLAQAFSAFRQRWATGLVLDSDDDGNPVEPFNSAVDRLWTSEDDVKFGEFSEATLTNYTSAIEADVHHLAAVTRTPPHYLLGQITNVNAEAIAAAETGLARKVASLKQTWGESWEEVMTLAAKAADRAEPITALETVWKRTETTSESQRVDAGLKKKGLGIPEQEIWADDLGASPQTIARWLRLQRQAAFRDSLRTLPVNDGQADPTAAENDDTTETA